MAFIVLVAVAILAGCVWMFLSHYDYPVAASDYDSAAKAYRAAGLPWELSDVQPNPPIKESDNAAEPLRQAIKSLNTIVTDEKTILSILKSPYDKADYAKLLKKIKAGEDLQWATEASKRLHLDWNRNWNKGAELLFPEYAHTKQLVKRLLWRAEARAGLNDPEGAVKDLQAAWRLSGLSGQEPSLICYLVRLNNETATLRTIERCAALQHRNVSFLEQLSQFLNVRPPIDFPYAVRGEMFFAVATLRTINLNDLHTIMPFPGQVDDPVEKGMSEGERRKAFFARLLRACLDMDAEMKRHNGDPHAMGRALDDVVIRYTSMKGKSNRIANIFPIFNNAGTSTVGVLAEIRATQALLHALQTKAKTGSFPARIEEIDPFTQKPLLLKRTQNGIRIYSLGSNQKDDGGFLAREKKSTRDKYDDIPAAYPPIPPRP